VTPISGRVTSISTTGMAVEAKLEAENPNDFDIKVKSFTATIVVDGKYSIGTVTSNHALTLPAHKKKQFDLPISMNWSDVGALVPLSLSNRDVPYEASGDVTVVARSVEIELPYKVTGVITHQQIVQAVGKSLPKIPGLPF
jgi:LEA14-like dessication related protein